MPDDAAAAALIVMRANWQARPLAAVLNNLPALAGIATVQMVDENRTLQDILDEFAGGPLVAVCDQVHDYWVADRWTVPDPWPESVELIRFPLLECKSLWPLAHSDPRNQPERHYPGGRYPFSDRIAASLSGEAGSDDEIYARYLAASRAELPDLEAAMIADIVAMMARDALCDVRFGLFFAAEFRTQQLFHAGLAPAGPACTELAARLARRLASRIGLDPPALDAAVRRYTHGMSGIAHEQHPIHPAVAEQLGLLWYDDAMQFRSFKTRWTFRDSMLRAIRWTPWVA